MQRFIAILDRPIDEEKFKEAWAKNKDLTSPPVEFQLSGERAIIIVHSSASAPWDETNFRTIFQLATHRVDPNCNVRWVEGEDES